VNIIEFRQAMPFLAIVNGIACLNTIAKNGIACLNTIAKKGIAVIFVYRV
jgi:hypothetical protein